MLSLIIPTYQERENLELLLTRLAAVRPAIGAPLEVLIVDDGSPDGTAERAHQLLVDFDLGRVIRREGVRDLSSAALEGIRQARGDLLGFMDADLSHPPETLPALTSAVRSGAEVAVASRYVRGARVTNWPGLRHGLSRVANLLARPLAGIADATSGYFVCRADCLKALTWRPKGFKILLELLVRGCLHRVQEVPYEFTDRRRGRSKLRLRTMGLYGRQLVALGTFRLRYPCRHRHDRPFDSGPGLGRGTLAQDVARTETKGRPERAKRVEGRHQWSPGLARGAPHPRLAEVIGEASELKEKANAHA